MGAEREQKEPTGLMFIPDVGWVAPCDWADVLENQARKYGGTGYRYHPETDPERGRERER